MTISYVGLIILLHPRQLQLTMKAVVLNGQLQAKRLEQVRNLIKSNSNLLPDKVEKDMGSFDQLPLGTILPWVSKPTKLGCEGAMTDIISIDLQSQILLHCLRDGSPALVF